MPAPAPKHRRISGCAELLEELEIFKLSEILKHQSETFITHLYKNALFLFAKMYYLFFLIVGLDKSYFLRSGQNFGEQTE